MTTQADSKKKGGVVNDILLEILREGGSRQKKAEPEKTSQEELLRRQFEQLQVIHRQEHLIFTRKHQEEQLKIKTLQEELKELIESVKNLDNQIEKTVAQIPVEPGVYHLNFFEKLRQFIYLLRKRVEEANSWLEVFNKRTAKGYWARFRKSGTQWSLSSERYVATSVG